MSGAAKKTPQPTPRATKDMQLVQALNETRRMSATRTEDPGWRELHERVDRILEAIGESVRGEPAEPPTAGMNRVDRHVIQIDPESADRVAASLMALTDRPDDRHVDLANETLRSVEEDLT